LWPHPHCVEVSPLFHPKQAKYYSNVSITYVCNIVDKVDLLRSCWPTVLRIIHCRASRSLLSR